MRRGHGGGLLGGSKTSFACSVSGEDVGRWALRGCAVGSWRLEVGPGLVKRERVRRGRVRGVKRGGPMSHVPCPAYLDRVVVGSSAGVDFFPDLIQGRDVIGHARDTQAAVFTRCVLQIENTPIFGCRCMPPHQTDTSLHHRPFFPCSRPNSILGRLLRKHQLLPPYPACMFPLAMQQHYFLSWHSSAQRCFHTSSSIRTPAWMLPQFQLYHDSTHES